MQRLLLVTYHFPPEPAAGARRPGFLAKYLPEYGWDVTVLTRPLGGDPQIECNVIAAPVAGARVEHSLRSALCNAKQGDAPPPALRVLLRHAKEALLFPDRAAAWLPGAISRGLAMCREQRFFAVLSTSMPASAHVAGAAIAAMSGLPWLADFRDLWHGNPTLHRSSARAGIEALLERVLIRRADALTTISAPLAERLEAFHGRPVTVIPNAYDPTEWTGLEAAQPRGFELCYTGSLYDGARSPALLFEALAALRREGDPAAQTRVSFFGPNSDHVGELARRFGVADIVHQYGVVPRPHALAEQRLASTLLVFLNLDESTSHELGSKIIEYAGAQRPIVAFGPRNSMMREYLAANALGWFAHSLDEAIVALRAAHARYVSGNVSVALAPSAGFSAHNLARAFAGQLGSLQRFPGGLTEQRACD